MYNKKFDLNSDMIYQQIKNEGEYNVNEIYHLKDEEYVFRPFKQYFNQAQEIATPLLQEVGQNLSFDKLFNVKLGMSIHCQNLYRVFYSKFFMEMGVNIHEFSIREFQSLCIEQGFGFSDVYLEEELLSFCWKTKEPVYLQDADHVVQIIQEFLAFIDSLGVEGFHFDDLHSEFSVFSARSLTWNGELFETYGNKDDHRKCQLVNASYGLLQEDGTVECYDVNENLLSYGIKE